VKQGSMPLWAADRGQTKEDTIFRWRFRLAHRIVASVVLGLALILVLFGLVAVWTVQQATTAEYAARLQLTRTLAAETDVTVQAAAETLARAATRLAGTTSLAAAQTALGPLLGPDGPFSTVEMLDSTGQEQWFGAVRAGSVAPRWASAPIAKTARTRAAADAGDCPDDEQPSQPALCLVAPLGTTAPASLLIAELDARDGTLPLVPPSGLPSRADVQVLDGAGLVIAASDPAGEGAASEHATLLRSLLGDGQSGVLLHRPGPGERFPPHLVAYAPLQLLPGWGLAVEIPQDQVLAAPRQLAERLVAFGVGALLLAAVVAWVDVHRVVRPLGVLTQAAERFASGALDMPVPLKRQDELGILATSFETMRKRLQASLAEIERGRQELEQRVAERTAQVAEQHQRLAALHAEATRLNAALAQQTTERAVLLNRVLSAQEGERERVARDLHDSTGQSLAAVLLSLELLDEQLPIGSSAARQSLRRSRDLATSALTELRALIADLRPALLDDLGLVPALRAFANQRLEEQGVDVSFAVTLPQRLPPEVEIALFRIVQEALTNVAKHAHAHHVTVELGQHDGRLEAIISDDGRGFDADQARADAVQGAHVGLLGMRERAELLGGEVRISAQPGHGCTVRVRVPLAPLEGR
jgi:signal transduction histidine kinase